jgi:hypothetical protein
LIAKTPMSYSSTSAAATSSCVESGLDANHGVGAARPERAHEVRRLGGHVETRGNAHPRERLLPLEPLADRGEHRHLAVGPLDPALALGGEGEILHVVSLRRSHQSFLVGRRAV